MSKEAIRPSQFCRVSVITEDAVELNEQQLQELADLYSTAVDKLKKGSLITGKILRVESNGAIVDINYKSNGIIPRYEFAEHEMKNLKEGAEIDVILDELENVDGNVQLSYEKAKALKAWDKITKLFDDNQPVEGTVTHTVKGGLSVDIGIPAFLPGSQVDLQRVMNFDQYVGHPITAKIIKINKKRGNVIISRRQFLAEQREGARKEIMEKINEGSVIQGVVKNVTNYGVFIDIGGVDGLLHITDMTWGRISHPSELVKIGETVTVKVLSIDKENNKISLGMKQLTDNPWEKIPADVQVGSRIKGKISSITDYGMFIEVLSGIEGLVHISEISWTDRINDLNKLYRAGQEIDVVVVALDKENRRMSLSVKQLEDNPWKSVVDKFKIGDKIKGTISNITDFGLFIQLIPGVDGLAHVSDLSWTEHIDYPGDIYKKGETVEAAVLNIDEDSKKISLGIKQLLPDPWETVETDYVMGSIVEGTVSKLANFGAFIKLPNGIEGLVHISDLGDKKVNEAFKVGDKREFRVVNTNKEERKLSLSTKLEADVEQKTKEKVATPAPAKKEKQSAAPKVAEGPKPKSQLQLALEKVVNQSKNKE
jgi:small subunit ribosomal protein S1